MFGDQKPSEASLLELLDTYSDYLTQGNPLWDFLRPIGMKIAEGGAWLIDGLYGVMGDLLKLLTIFDNESFVALLDKIEPLKWFLFTLALVGFFVLLMFSRAKDTAQAPLNLLLVLCMTLLLPSLWQTASTATQAIFTEIHTVEQSPGEQIILENTTDMKLVAEKGWKLKKGETQNNYKHARQIDMKEKLEQPDEIDNGEALKQRLVTDTNGNDQLEEIQQPGGIAKELVKSIYSPFYYRNHVRFFNIYLTMLVSIVALGISSFKFAIIIIKMYGDYVLLLKGGFADFMGLQRVKAIVSELVGSFALLVYIPILFQIYIISTVVIKSMNFNFFSYIIAMAGAAWALIDGPNGFQRVTGIDAGLRGTAGVLMTALGSSSLVKGATHLGTTIAKSAGGALAAGGAFGLGMSFANTDSTHANRSMKGVNQQEKEAANGSHEGNERKGFNEQVREKEQDQKQGIHNESMNQQDASKKGTESNGQENPSMNDANHKMSSEENPAESTVQTEPENTFDQTEPINKADERSQPEMFNQPNIPEAENGQEYLADSNSSVSSAQDKVDDFSGSTGERPTEEKELSRSLDDERQSNKLDQQLVEHKKANPLKKAAKDKVFGYSKEDPRRYQLKPTFREKRRDAFDLGKNYRAYRDTKRELMQQKKEIGKKSTAEKREN